MTDKIEKYVFRFINDLEAPPIQLRGLGHETRTQKNYSFDNRKRFMEADYYLFQFTVSGCGILELDGKEIPMAPGKGFLLPLPGNEKYYFSPKASDRWEFIYIMFYGSACVSYCQYIISTFGKVQTLPEDHPALKQLWHMIGAARDSRLNDPFLTGSEVFHFLSLLCMHPLAQADSSGKISQKTIDFMKKNYQQLNGISEIADFLGVTQSYLSRTFLRETGMHPVDYLRKLRLEHAIHLLLTTSDTVTEICHQCGYPDNNYFNKVFAKYLGMPPGQFRKYVKTHGYRNIQI